MSVTDVKNYLSLFPLQKFQKQEGKLGSQLLKSGQTRTTTQKHTTQLKLNGVEPFVFLNQTGCPLTVTGSVLSIP